MQNNRPVELFELSVPIALGFCGLVIFGLWLGGRLNCRVIAGVNRRVMLLTFGTLVLGPLLAINGILKSFWGRARPMEIFEFGGFKTFSPAGIISNQCSLDCSFASGHTAMGFWALSLALLAPRRFRRQAVAAALTLGALLGIGRIAQGMHFLSDVLFAAFITCGIILWMHRSLYPEEYE